MERIQCHQVVGGARSKLQHIVEADPYPFMLYCQMRDQHCRQVLQALQADILWK